MPPPPRRSAIPRVFVRTAARRACASALLSLASMAARSDGPDPTALIVVQEGSLPIVFSVPHAGAADVPGVPPRTGAGASNFITARDARADLLAEKTAAALSAALGGRPCLVIARFDRKYIDANRRAEDAYESDLAKPVYEAYHRAIAAACRAVRERWGRGLLIDIHGQSTETNAIFRGTVDGLTFTNLLARFGETARSGPDSIFGRLAARGYRVIPPVGDAGPEYPRYRGGYIVRTHGAHAPGGLDAMMIEFGRHLRRPENLDRMAADFADAIAAFARAFLPSRPLDDGRLPAAAGGPGRPPAAANQPKREGPTP